MKLLFIFLFIFTVYLYDFLAIKMGMSFIDEFLILTMSIYSFFLFLKRKIVIYAEEKKIVYSFVGVVILGFLGAAVSGLQPVNVQLVDLIIFSKFIIAYFSMRIMCEYFHYNYILRKSILNVFLTLLLIIVLCLILDKLFNLFPIFDYRYWGWASEELFYGHPSRFAFVIQMFLVLMLPLVKKDNKIIVLYAFILFLGFLSLRTKFFIFLSMFMTAILYLKCFKYKKKSYVKILIVAFVFISLALVVSSDKIFDQLLVKGDGTQAVRGLLLVAGFDIALNHFPFGAGFGSYGSYASAVNYSSLYVDYHFDQIPGTMPDKPSFLVDNFYAMLLGEFGFIGFCLFIYVLYLYVRILFRAINSDPENAYYYCGGVMLLLIILYEGLSDSLFVQNRGVFVAIYIALLVSKKSYRDRFLVQF